MRSPAIGWIERASLSCAAWLRRLRSRSGKRLGYAYCARRSRTVERRLPPLLPSTVCRPRTLLICSFSSVLRRGPSCDRARPAHRWSTPRTPDLGTLGRNSMPRRRRRQAGDAVCAADIIEFIEQVCFVPEGRLVGKKLKLLDWQKDLIRLIYDNPNGTRRAIVSMGRKNAKTTLAACLLLAHLCGPPAKSKPNSQLFSAAQSRD